MIHLLILAVHLLATIRSMSAVEGVTKPALDKRRARRPTLASVAKQASKAGVVVARYEVEPDGKITIIPGQPEADQTTDLDKWMAKHHAN
jgi:hypothetical protein